MVLNCDYTGKQKDLLFGFARDQVIASAPVRFLVSGMGDALSTWFEADSCYRKYAGNITGRAGSMTAYALAHLCYETLMDYGVDARTACETHAVVPAFERIVEANTLLSGLGFESGGLAAAHAIHNGLTALEATHHSFHGENEPVPVTPQRVFAALKAADAEGKWRLMI